MCVCVFLTPRPVYSSPASPLFVRGHHTFPVCSRPRTCPAFPRVLPLGTIWCVRVQARTFAFHRRADMAGLLLIDTSHEEQRQDGLGTLALGYALLHTCFAPFLADYALAAANPLGAPQVPSPCT